MTEAIPEADVTFTEAQIESVRRAFPADWAKRGNRESPSDWASECLSEHADAVEDVFAWGADEPVAIQIRGVPGAYFVSAIEFEDVGVFTTLEEAREGRDDAFRGAALFDDEEGAWAFAEEHGCV